MLRRLSQLFRGRKVDVAEADSSAAGAGGHEHAPSCSQGFRFSRKKNGSRRFKRQSKSDGGILLSAATSASAGGAKNKRRDSNEDLELQQQQWDIAEALFHYRSAALLMRLHSLCHSESHLSVSCGPCLDDAYLKELQHQRHQFLMPTRPPSPLASPSAATLDIHDSACTVPAVTPLSVRRFSHSISNLSLSLSAVANANANASSPPPSTRGHPSVVSISAAEQSASSPRSVLSVCSSSHTESDSLEHRREYMESLLQSALADVLNTASSNLRRVPPRISPNMEIPFGTPLMWCLDLPEMVVCILSRQDVDTEVRTFDGFTALLEGCRRNTFGSISALVLANANLLAVSSAGENVLTLCVHYGSLESLSVILDTLLASPRVPKAIAMDMVAAALELAQSNDCVALPNARQIRQLLERTLSSQARASGSDAAPLFSPLPSPAATPLANLPSPH